MKTKKPVMRMCTACKQMKDKSELIRVVKNKDGDIFVDTTGKAAGRGAFVCKMADCIQKSKKQRSLNRAFKCEIPSSIYDQLTNLAQQS